MNKFPTISVVDHDLIDEDWVLGSEEGKIDVQGAQNVVLFFESAGKDDNQFEVKVLFLDKMGNVRATVDQNVDSSLLSTSPTNGNHYVFVTVSIASQYVDIRVEDVSGATTNRVTGTINFN